MDTRTHYMGLELEHPVVVGASPLVDDLDTAMRLEDAGAAAIVMHSLFEEQIRQEQVLTFLETEVPSESFAEATSYFPTAAEYALGPERYLEQIEALKARLSIPVIASLNGVTPGGWTEYARLIEQAGADALELNVYEVATDPQADGGVIENRTIELVRSVREDVSIPIAVKLSPFYTSFAHFAHRLDQTGVDGLVLFNRFYQPDIDPEELETVPRLRLSSSAELLLRLRWLAILHGRVECSLAVSGGVHGPIEAVKALMAGADTVQMVSAVLRDGPDAVTRVRDGLVAWLEEHEYAGLGELRGSMSLRRCPDPAAFERGNYLRVLQSWDARRLARGDDLLV